MIRLIKKQMGHQTKVTGAEIGVWQGAFSRVMFRKLAELHLYMIDPYVPWSHESKHKQGRINGKLMAAKKSTDFAGDRRKMLIMSSEEAAPLFADESLDFVFIDANHDYEYVMQDILLWTPKVRPGGIVAGHDYFNDVNWCPGVRKAIHEYFDPLPDYELKSMRGMVWYTIKPE
jgi:predicted O-methyltransferase YrrM